MILRPIRSGSYLERMDRIPPFFCRVIARTPRGQGQRAMTIREIAQQSGLSWERVSAIARKQSFATVPLGEAEAFRRGCGITLGNEWRHIEYLKRTLDGAKVKKPFRHIRSLPRDYRKRIEKLIP